ncbi:MAG: hypothetical protein Q8R67_09965 [Rhodoferax sp.]|nr:hypothetical protein [Rhodoferax sp.]MDP3651995.1 hypothetical protein [Rhodoferax sp.]
MKLSTKIAQLALVLGALPVAALAGDTGTVYTQLGTNGLGIGYAASVSDDWAVRGQYNTMKQSFSGDVGDFGSGSSLDVKIDFNSLQLVGDWYPMGEGFRVSGGVVFNNNKITLNGTGSVNNGPQTAVTAEIKMSDGVAPYLGIGYSTKPKVAKGLGFNFDLGVMVQNPKATLTAPAASAADVAAEQAQMQDAVDKLKYMPVLALGISYSF